jgi:hypothetical protein
LPDRRRITRFHGYPARIVRETYFRANTIRKILRCGGKATAACVLEGAVLSSQGSCSRTIRRATCAKLMHIFSLFACENHFPSYSYLFVGTENHKRQ